MAESGEKRAADAEFKKVWNKAMQDYSGKAEHDLSMFVKYSGCSLDELSKKFIDDDEHFKKIRKGRENMRKTRSALKACIAPVDALSAIASSAISLSPFAPAATIFGAGTYLMKACGKVADAYDGLTKLLEYCKEYIDRLQVYVKTEISEGFLPKIAAIFGFMLQAFADCERQLVDDKNDKVKRWGLWVRVALLGQRPDETLKNAQSRLQQYFSEEERYNVAQIYLEVHQIQSDVGKLVSRSDKDYVQKVIESLPVGPFDLAAKQIEDNNKSLLSPPNWVLQDQGFVEWWKGTTPDTRWLWGLGSTGAGKTSIVSFLTARWQATCNLTDDSGEIHTHEEDSAVAVDQDVKRHTAVAFYYGDYRTKDEQRPDVVFQSLIRQLLNQLRVTDSAVLEQRCQQVERLKGASDDDGDTVTELSWTGLLNDLTDDFGRCFIVVDALDDQEEGYKDLILKLGGLTSPNLKLFVTSRNTRSLREDAEDRAKLLEISARDEQIKDYIQARLRRIETRIEHYDSGEWIQGSALPDYLGHPSRFERVSDTVLSNAKNNFYRAEVQITSLKAARDADSIEQKLEALSKDLGDVIQLDIEMIRAQTDAHKQQVGNYALMLATYAARALTITEMQHALVLLLSPQARENPFDHRKEIKTLSKDYVLDASCGTLELDEGTGRIRLDEAMKAHCKGMAIFASAHYEIATICLIYLDRMFFSLRSASRTEYELRKEQYPLYEYAARFWAIHAREAGESRFLKPSSPVSMPLILSRKLFLDIVAVANHEDLQTVRMWNWAGRDSWRDLSDLPKRDITNRVGGQTFIKPAQPVVGTLHLLIYFNLPLMVSWWLQQHPGDVQSASSTGTTPLYLACHLGRTRIVETLLFDFHADPLSKGAEPAGYNLAAAVFSQSTEIVERLLYFRSKELLQQTNWHGKQPLGEAVTRGNTDIVRLLIDASITLDKDGLLKHGERDGWTALHEAATVAHSSTAMRWLVEATGGKDLLQRTTKKWRDTALHLAARDGHVDTVQTLLELGADPVARQSLGKTPLMLAVEGVYDKNEQVIRTLVQWGKAHCLKDYELAANDGHTTWHLAVNAGRPRNVELLIKLYPKSMFTEKNRFGETPIRLGAQRILERKVGGYVQCIDVLLRDQPNKISEEDAHAVFNALMIERAAPIIALSALEKLLRHEIRPWPMLAGDTTILHRALREGTLQAVQTVWRSPGAPSILEQRDTDGSTPLLLAARLSKAQESLFLLDNGADPTAQDKTGRTALHYGIEHDLKDLVRQLLESALDPHVEDAHGIAALDRASAHNSCLELSQVRYHRRARPQRTEHECVRSIRTIPRLVVSGPVMRDEQIKRGIAPDTIDFQHAEYLRSDPIPFDAKLPVSYIEVSLTWRVFENNLQHDVAVNLDLRRGDELVRYYTIFNSSEQPNRAKNVQTRRAVWHLKNDIVNELRPKASPENEQKAKDFVRLLRIGDCLALTVHANGHGRIAFVDDAEIRVVYED